jgi:hypothetical protein
MKRRAIPGSGEMEILKRRLDRAKAQHAAGLARGEDVQFWHRVRVQAALALGHAMHDARARASAATKAMSSAVTRQRGRAPGGRPGHRRTHRSSRDGPPGSDEGPGEPAPPIGGPE